MKFVSTGSLLVTCLHFADGLGLLKTSPQQQAIAVERANVKSTTEVSLDTACGVSSSGPICFAQAGRVQNLLPDAVPEFLVAHWDFNGDAAIDRSGSGNHGVTELVHGPSPGGSGHSAAFTKNFMMVPDSAQLKLPDFTYSFWVYLADDDVPSAAGPSATWCPLIRKGVHMPETQQFSNAPALLFNHRTGRLRAEVTTTMKEIEDGEHIDSNARLLPNRWLHIAMVHHTRTASDSSLLLYVNGILDSMLKTQGTPVMNDYPLYVGGDPFTQDQCGFTVYVDELRIYSHAVAPHQLQAEAAPALGGTDPSYVHLGCAQCSLEDAARRCPGNRHICTAMELHTGGYQVARSLGWLSSGTHVWTHAAVSKRAASQPAESSTGLGLCCEGAP